MRTRRAAAHAVWAALGAAYAASLWFVYSMPGALGLFACIAASFVLWYRMTPRGAWLAVVVLGAAMAGVLTTQAVTSSRCPAPGEKVILKEGKPPVSCDEIRASTGAMALFFGLLGLAGLVVPVAARRPLAPQPELDEYGNVPA